MLKISKHEHTDSYFNTTRHISKCMMKLNSHVVPVRTQTTNTQKMNNVEISTQKTPNFRICSTEESESKRIKVYERESHICATEDRKSKRVIVYACYLDKSESKSVHKSVNTSEVKYAMNETKDGEPPVTDNSVINAPIHFKLFQCSKNFFNNIYSTYELACIATFR